MNGMNTPFTGKLASQGNLTLSAERHLRDSFARR